jgi:hypothetical protein
VRGLRREWEPEELIASWTLLDDDWRLWGTRRARLDWGFSLIVEFFAIETRRVRCLLGGYDWSGRSIERHRAQIRQELGFRQATREDEEDLIEWLPAEICPVVVNDDGVRAAMLARCRKLGIEPPGRLERILRGARSQFDKGFCAEIVDRSLTRSTSWSNWPRRGRVSGGVEVRSGPLGLDTFLEEIVKLGRAEAIGLPADLLSGHSAKLVALWRVRAAACYPSDLLANPCAVRLTLLAALCWSRTSEISDALVDLLIQLVSRINTRPSARGRTRSAPRL